ncbi:MAG: FAD-dependent oxidoreductase [Candidatus Omnitrophica bacterium]|nr:FAD-dependent oxidoreductase [Candidatus Omnitrophota bacterium]
MAEKPRFYEGRLSKIVSLSETVKHFVLDYAPSADLSFTAGQFLMAHLEKDGKPHKKAYSIASSPTLALEKKQIELCIKRVEGGYVSTWFFGLKEGDVIRTSLPHGVFTVKEPWQENLVFVGTGTGIAPLRGMIHKLYESGCDKEIWLVFGNRYETDILYDEEWRALEKERRNFHYLPTISRPKHWTGETAYVQEVVKKTFARHQDSGGTAGGAQGDLDFYGCGLVPMCQELKAALLQMNVPKERIHFEQFT